MCLPENTPFGVCCSTNEGSRAAGGIFYFTQQASTIASSVLGILAKQAPDTIGISYGSQTMYWISLALQLLEAITSRIELYRTRTSFTKNATNGTHDTVKTTSILWTLPIAVTGLTIGVVFGALGYYDASLSKTLQTIFVGLAAPLSKLALNFDKQIIAAEIKSLT